LNLAKQKLPNINVGISATDSFVSQHSDVVTKFMTALKKGIDREKSDEKYSAQVLKEHLGVSDQKALEATWKYYALQVLPKVPTPTAAQLKAAQDSLEGSVPGVGKVDLNKMIDTSYVDKVFNQS